MKLLVSLATLIGIWMTFSSALPASMENINATKQTFYYWYWTDTDTYLEYATTTTAINDLEFMTGKLVNTRNIGGTLVAKGFTKNDYPHTTVPAIWLYTH